MDNNYTEQELFRREKVNKLRLLSSQFKINLVSFKFTFR